MSAGGPAWPDDVSARASARASRAALAAIREDPAGLAAVLTDAMREEHGVYRLLLAMSGQAAALGKTLETVTEDPGAAERYFGNLVTAAVVAGGVENDND